MPFPGLHWVLSAESKLHSYLVFPSLSLFHFYRYIFSSCNIYTEGKKVSISTVTIYPLCESISLSAQHLTHTAQDVNYLLPGSF